VFRQRRQARGLSVQQLVDRMTEEGVVMSRAAWSNYENRDREDVTLTQAVAAALVLNLSLPDLVGPPDSELHRLLSDEAEGIRAREAIEELRPMLEKLRRAGLLDEAP
jgi:transcriptional regulator with XRE-family HTH domain